MDIDNSSRLGRFIKHIVMCKLFALHEYDEVVLSDWSIRPLRMGIFRQCKNCGDQYKIAGEDKIAGLSHL